MSFRVRISGARALWEQRDRSAQQGKLVDLPTAPDAVSNKLGEAETGDAAEQTELPSAKSGDETNSGTSVSMPPEVSGAASDPERVDHGDCSSGMSGLSPNLDDTLACELLGAADANSVLDALEKVGYDASISSRSGSSVTTAPPARSRQSFHWHNFFKGRPTAASSDQGPAPVSVPTAQEAALTSEAFTSDVSSSGNLADARSHNVPQSKDEQIAVLVGRTLSWRAAVEFLAVSPPHQSTNYGSPAALQSQISWTMLEAADFHRSMARRRIADPTLQRRRRRAEFLSRRTSAVVERGDLSDERTESNSSRPMSMSLLGHADDGGNDAARGRAERPSSRVFPELNETTSRVVASLETSSLPRLRIRAFFSEPLVKSSSAVIPRLQHVIISVRPETRIAALASLLQQAIGGRFSKNVARNAAAGIFLLRLFERDDILDDSIRLVDDPRVRERLESASQQELDEAPLDMVIEFEINHDAASKANDDADNALGKAKDVQADVDVQQLFPSALSPKHLVTSDSIKGIFNGPGNSQPLLTDYTSARFVLCVRYLRFRVGGIPLLFLRSLTTRAATPEATLPSDSSSTFLAEGRNCGVFVRFTVTFRGKQLSLPQYAWTEVSPDLLVERRESDLVDVSFPPQSAVLQFADLTPSQIPPGAEICLSVFAFQLDHKKYPAVGGSSFERYLEKKRAMLACAHTPAWDYQGNLIGSGAEINLGLWFRANEDLVTLEKSCMHDTGVVWTRRALGLESDICLCVSNREYFQRTSTIPLPLLDDDRNINEALDVLSLEPMQASVASGSPYNGNRSKHDAHVQKQHARELREVRRCIARSVSEGWLIGSESRLLSPRDVALLWKAREYAASLPGGIWLVLAAALMDTDEWSNGNRRQEVRRLFASAVKSAVSLDFRSPTSSSGLLRGTNRSELPLTLHAGEILPFLGEHQPDPILRSLACRVLLERPNNFSGEEGTTKRAHQGGLGPGVSDADFLAILPQLVQALKHEPYHMSELIWLLFTRSLQSRDIGHALFWELRTELVSSVDGGTGASAPQHPNGRQGSLYIWSSGGRHDLWTCSTSVPANLGLANQMKDGEQFRHRHWSAWNRIAARSAVAFRYQLLLEAFLLACSDEARHAFLGQDSLIRQLSSSARLVASARERSRTDVFADCLTALQVDVPFTTPLDPGLLLEKVDPAACKFFSSKTTPILLGIRRMHTREEVKPVLRGAADTSESDCYRIIFKRGDDLRQDILVTQLLSTFDRMWRAANMDLEVQMYRIVATGPDSGLIEVAEGQTLADIQLGYGGSRGAFSTTYLYRWLENHCHANKGSSETESEPNREKSRKRLFKRARVRFTRSLAAYCVATYVLGVGDRHNDNIMVSATGRFFHIDFGRVFGNWERFAGMSRDRSPFIFTPDLAYVVDPQAVKTTNSETAPTGLISNGTSDERNLELDSRGKGLSGFIGICCAAFNVLRQNARAILGILTLMAGGAVNVDVAFVRKRLHLHLSELDAAEYFRELIFKSLRERFTRINFYVHNKVKEKAQQSRQQKSALKR